MPARATTTPHKVNLLARTQAHHSGSTAPTRLQLVIGITTKETGRGKDKVVQDMGSRGKGTMGHNMGALLVLSSLLFHRSG